MIEQSVEEIEEACPDVSQETLLNDAETVQASLWCKDIFFFLLRGFSSREAEQATICGWKQLRISRLDPTAALSSKELIGYVSGFSKLVIKINSERTALIEMELWQRPFPRRQNMARVGHTQFLSSKAPTLDGYQ